LIIDRFDRWSNASYQLETRSVGRR